MKRFISLAILIMSATLASCQSTGSNKNATTAGNTIKSTINADEFEKKLKTEPAAQVVDVRTPEEYAGGHLKNAVNINIRDNSFDEHVAKLDKNKPVMVYCKAGSRSASAAEKLQAMGFKVIYNLDGGIMQWENAGKPLAGPAAVGYIGMTIDAFTKLVSQKNYVLVDYNAHWCEPCKKMLPMLESLAEKKKDKLTLLKIDADENKDLLKAKGVAGIPYLELYKDGKLVWSHNGAMEEEALLKETSL